MPTTKIPAAIGEKLERAYEHLAYFDALRQQWVNTDSGEIVHENHPESGEYLVICKRAAAPPPRLGVVLGEVVHGFRSTLDHLVYALAVHESQQDPPPFADKWEFPIFRAEKNFNAKWNKYLPIFSTGAQSLFRDLQPFTEYDGNLTSSRLWILHCLDNINKHRRPGVIGQALTGTVEIAGSTDIGLVGMSAGILKDDAVLFHFTTDGSDGVNVNLNLTFDVAFDEPDILPQHPQVFPILGKLGELTAAIVNDCDKFF